MLHTYWYNGKAALIELPHTEKFFHIFWLLGPFFLLIERTPGDLWLSLIAVSFIVSSILKKNYGWIKVFWVQAVFAFWFVCLVSAALSNDAVYSIGEAIVWMRFPLFAMAVAFWLGRDVRLLYLMLISIAASVVLMCFILSAEMFFLGHVGNRLSWPYGDLVPGGFLAKAGLPAVIVSVATAVSTKGRVAIFAGLFAIASITFVILTGERINALIMLCSGILAGIILRPTMKRYFIMSSLVVLSIILVFQFFPNTGNRFLASFLSQIPTNGESPYFEAMLPAILFFEQSPILGIGTANFRNLCPELLSPLSNLPCHPHPHNYYIQLLGETGVLGFLSGILFISSIIWYCFKTGWKISNNVVLATAWIVPFAFFWPIASSADFFGQWNNLFMWSSISFSLAVCTSYNTLNEKEDEL